MRFTAPPALLLLLLLPAFAAWGWPSRGFGRRREVVSMILRLLIVLCLVLSLAGLEIVRSADRLAVVFLVDRSDSISASARLQAEDYMRRALGGMKPDDQAAMIVFGGDALVERAMSPGQELGGIASVPRGDQTDLAKAIRLGLALFPPDAARRMVILSDGDVTTGEARAAAQLAAASDVQILAVPLASASGPEAWVTSLQAPAHLRQGETFDLDLGIQATAAMPAGITVVSSGVIVYQGRQELKSGEQSFSLPLQAGEPGFTRYTVQISPQQDHYYQNNELSTFAQVEGSSRILLVAPPQGEPLPFSGGRSGQARPDEAAQLFQALKAADFDVQRVKPTGLPSDLVDLAPYASLILVDVPASDLSQRQMLAVQSYVRDLGGGLVVVGGPTSYGVGGYFHTPLEETLPVEMQIKDEKRRPSLAMVFIIDHSGSMSETSGGVAKLELAKEAVIRSVDLLFPGDRIGVIAFDDSASWVVPITSLSDPGPVKDAVGSIRSGGGTDILAGLQAMAQVLPEDPASLKHVILLTDGGADPTGIPQLVEKLNKENGITLTTIGVGQDAAPYLSQLAEEGGGRYHFAADPGAIPQIFTEETSLATRSYLVEHTFTPQQASASPILSGIRQVPALQGYVGATSKSVAQTILVSDLGDPILAAWQYGLGKAIAFTSDASSRWAQDWVGWAGFPTFWAQAASYTLSDRAPSNLEVHVEGQPGGAANQTGLLTVEAQTENGEFLNNYAMQANVVSPDGKVQSLSLKQVAPGRYQAPFEPGIQGAYLVGVTGKPPQVGVEIGATAGWVLSYSPEYRDLNPDPQELANIAAITGGRVAGDNVKEVFNHDLPSGRATRPVWPALLVLAALLLPFDVAVRRLALGPGELARGLMRWVNRLRQPGKEISPQPARSQHMDALLKAKQRLAQPEPPSSSRPDREASPVSEKVPALAGEPRAADSSPEREPSPSHPEESAPASTAASLLAAKRAKRKEKR